MCVTMHASKKNYKIANTGFLKGVGSVLMGVWVGMVPSGTFTLFVPEIEMSCS